jgi:acyl-CoA thioester hydrolase
MSKQFKTDELNNHVDEELGMLSHANILKWKYPHPFVRTWKITQEHIDHYQHTNNVAYLSRLERLAWEHSRSLGLEFSDYQSLDRAMVITQHNLQYHAPSHLNDKLACATWIVKCDHKFRLSRCFEFIKLGDNRKDEERSNTKVVFSAQTDFVCCSLSTGMPKKMPKAFAEIYGSALIDAPPN